MTRVRPSHRKSPDLHASVPGCWRSSRPTAPATCSAVGGPEQGDCHGPEANRIRWPLGRSALGGSRVAMRYDRARNNLDRHPNYILAP